MAGADQLSIQELAENVHVARQKAALGLYEESIRTYRNSMILISQHMKQLADPFLKEQWKKTDEEIRGELQSIYNLFKSLKIFRGETLEIHDGMMEPPVPAAAIPEKRQHRHKENDAVGEGNMKPPPSVLNRFGGAPFAKRPEDYMGMGAPHMQAHEKSAEEVARDFGAPPDHVIYVKAPAAENPPERDPMVWGPPPPMPPKKNPKKNLPGWAQGKGNRPGAAPKKYKHPHNFF